MSYLNTLGWTRIWSKSRSSGGPRIRCWLLARQYRKQDHCPADSKKST